MDCPQCGTVNPPEALRCDCGYDFKNRRPGGSTREPYLPDSDWLLWLVLYLLLPTLGPLVGIGIAISRMREGKRGARTMIALSVLVLALHVSVLLLVVLPRVME